MAVMRKEHKDIAELGPVGIVREGMKVYRAHAKVFLLIQGTLMLPLALVLLGISFCVPSELLMPPGQRYGRLGFARLGELLGEGPYMTSSARPPGFGPPGFLFLLVTSVNSLVCQVALSLAQSTSVYSVGLHYAGQPVSYVDVLCAATPRLWMRMAVTNIWFWFFSFFVSVVQTLSVTFRTPIAFLLWNPLVWSVFMIVAGIYINIVFMVTPGVSVLEDNYGWAAVGKSVKLMEGKKMTAFLFSLLWAVPTVIELHLGFPIFIYQLESSGAFLAATGAVNMVYLVWMIVVLQLQFLCSGVQYVSFKAFHNENLADPLPENSKMNGAYAKVSDGSDAAMLDGNQPDNLV